MIKLAIACVFAAGLTAGAGAANAAGSGNCVADYIHAHGPNVAAAQSACHIPPPPRPDPRPGTPACVLAYELAHGPASAAAGVHACGITSSNRNLRFTNKAGLVLSIEVVDGPTTDIKQSLDVNQSTLIAAPAGYDLGITLNPNEPGGRPWLKYYPAGSDDITVVMNWDTTVTWTPEGQSNPP
jgi:hypothetical protein